MPGTFKALGNRAVNKTNKNIYGSDGKESACNTETWVRSPEDPLEEGTMDCSLPGSSIHGIFQARVLEWGAIAFSNIHTAAAATKLLQSCPTLCNPLDGSPPGSPIPGILQASGMPFPSPMHESEK